MSDFINKINSINGLNKIKGCSMKQVQEAQTELDMSFPDEYIDYVRNFGCIDFGPTEWTGLNIEGYLNTVTATKEEIEFNPSFPKKHFVLEDLNIDAKKVIVNEKGEVFLLQYENKTFLCGSLLEYLDICIKRMSY